LSVVDMAVVLGPTNPPTLAVLIWRWLIDADPLIEAMGSSAAILMLVMLMAAVYGARTLWQFTRRFSWIPNGKRAPTLPVDQIRSPRSLVWPPLAFSGYVVIGALLVWSLAESWFFPALWPGGFSLEGWHRADFRPFITSLWLGVAVCLITLPITLLWLEWGPARFNALLYVPLIVPAMPLVVGQYAALLRLNLDGTAWALIWSHLLWVLPYMVLTVAGPYRAFDARLMTAAQALGCSRLKACMTVKWPMLLKPLLAALAVGFAVSIAQYLPTLFAGGGRFATVTTEAIALSAGGNRRILAVQALLQALLPLAAFGLAAWLQYWSGKQRRGLR